MFWDKWFSEEKEPEPAKNPARVVFELAEDGNVLIHCGWPTPQTNDDAVIFVEQYVMLLYLINSGKLLSSMEASIARFNSQDPINKQLAKAILTGIHQVLSNYPLYNPDDEKPLVPPTSVFSVRGENDRS